VLHFVEDREDPWAVVNCYKELVDVSEWRPDHIGPPSGPAVFYAGIGCKTRPGRPR
jgi:hypothetical protein